MTNADNNILLTKSSSNGLRRAIKTPKTNNRKKVTQNSHYEYKGEYFEINTGDGQHKVFPVVIEPIIKRLQFHNRSFVIRFDLHQTDHYAETSKMISQFFDRLKKRLRTLYPDIGQMHYVWSREQEKAKAQHYHAALILNYDIVNNGFKTGNLIREIWASIREGNTAHISKSTHQIKDRLSLADAIYHLSYLAKVRGKGYRPKQSKDYGASQLK